MNSKAEISYDFCLENVQEFGLRKRKRKARVVLKYYVIILQYMAVSIAGH